MPNKLESLDRLAGAVPGLNREAARQTEAARDILLQRQIQAAPQTGATAEQLAAQQAQMAGQQETSLLAQQQQQLKQIGGAGLQQQAISDQERLGTREVRQREEIESSRQQQLNEISTRQLESRKRITDNELRVSEELQNFGIYQDNRLQLATLKQREDLADLGSDVKNKILDSRIRFASDERGRKFTNERQLDDYVLANAKTEQEFNDHMRSSENLAKQKITMMEIANSKLKVILKQGFISDEGDLDRAHKEELTRIQQENQARLQREKSRAKGHRSRWVAGGKIVGAVAGGIIGSVVSPGAGTAVGASVGASVGGAVGAMGANATN